MASLQRRKRLTMPGENPFTATSSDYAHNLIVGTHVRRLKRKTVGQIESADLVQELVRSTKSEHRIRSPDGEGCFSTGQVARALRWYIRADPKLRSPRLPDAPVAGNLATLANITGLDEAQSSILQFLVAIQGDPELKEFAGTFGQLTLAGATTFVAAATQIDEESVLSSLSRNGRLFLSGLVEIADDIEDLASKIKLKRGVLDAVLTPGLNHERLLTRFLPDAGQSSLQWDDFQHVREAKLARDILGAALRSQRTGINVLFYGTTGTGKTELAKILASDLQSRLYVAGRSDSTGESAEPKERLSSLLLGQRVTKSGSAVLLFDELEDLFAWELESVFSGESQTKALMSKQWFNSLLETNPIPTIWISNRVTGIDPAFLRRFSFAVEFRPAGQRQRARILRRHLGENSNVTVEQVEAMAAQFAVSPAQIGSAVATARLISPGERPDRATIEQVLAPVEKLVTGRDSTRVAFDPASYHIEALNSPDDLIGVADRLASWQPSGGLGISLCLYGPPGTGKSEYVKYIAHRMGRPVLYRRASDILSKWVGQTEHLIAESFREAEDDGAVLLLDEVDSFLRDRQSARHSWEVTQVNEFLQQLEAFRGVVACTTNLWRNLDEASVRRFIFKIKFDFLDIERAMLLFKSVLGPCLSTPLTDEVEGQVRVSLAHVSTLAPGDFAAVSRRVRALGERPSAHALVAALVAETRAKGSSAQTIGF